MISNRQLDFFVIGAMKAGTTSLHYHLRKHPEIFVPFEKEVPFFAKDELYERGMDWYLDEFFSKAHVGQLIGTVSPPYMLHDEVPGRMHQAVPNAKLIAVLRDPIERAKSQYKMMARAFGERRSFSDALQEATPLSRQYVTAGEYGRVLDAYLKLFPRQQLLVIFSEDLNIDPGATFARICSFLGVDNRFVLPNLQERRNTASDSGSHPLARTAANFVHTYSRPLRPIIRKLTPERLTRRLGLWSIMYRSKVKDPSAIDARLTRVQERALAERYLEDLRSLENVAARPIPWRTHLEKLLRDD